MSEAARTAYHHGDLKSALVAAALGMVEESQDWKFSLREVARRAGVSHNAPYNHFPEKRDLLAAVAAVGFDTLRFQMEGTVADSMPPAEALTTIAVQYVEFGTQNRTLFHLMFGPTLVAADQSLPEVLEKAAASSKKLLFEVIARGAREGHFLKSSHSKAELHLAVLTAWSLVHGLTTLINDGLVPIATPVPARERQIESMVRVLLHGIKRH